ncbi:hypothetical protein GCM10010492_15260 [Saccharothrix mutabilis subsp. mutabilis]|uniref:Uncharacterized protein n=1 Tax=Saccharothrix mutabilis subsp. mutabilis TaxID=66855 RepID=A0ABP3CY26_9PSEU
MGETGGWGGVGGPAGGAGWGGRGRRLGRAGGGSAGGGSAGGGRGEWAWPPAPGAIVPRGYDSAAGVRRPWHGRGGLAMVGRTTQHTRELAPQRAERAAGEDSGAADRLNLTG